MGNIEQRIAGTTDSLLLESFEQGGFLAFVDALKAGALTWGEYPDIEKKLNYLGRGPYIIEVVIP
jgi:hypothetical protein